MRVFYAFRPIIGGMPQRIFMANHKPVREEAGDNVLFSRSPNDPDREFAFIEADPMALQGLGVADADIPGPGECKKLSMRSPGDPGTTEAKLAGHYTRG